MKLDLARPLFGNPRRWLALAITALLHGCLLWLLLQNRPNQRGSDVSEERFTVWLLAPEPTAPVPDPPQSAAPTKRAKPPAASSKAITENRIPETAAETATPPADRRPATEPRPAIDWAHEAQKSAQTLLSDAQPQLHSLDSKPASKETARKKTKTELNWTPKVPPIGLTREGLLHIQIGPCFIIALSFGCELGKKPSNKDLFEHMGDPNEAQGSVPDADP